MCAGYISRTISEYSRISINTERLMSQSAVVITALPSQFVQIYLLYIYYILVCIECNLPGGPKKWHPFNFVNIMLYKMQNARYLIKQFDWFRHLLLIIRSLSVCIYSRTLSQFFRNPGVSRHADCESLVNSTIVMEWQFYSHKNRTCLHQQIRNYVMITSFHADDTPVNDNYCKYNVVVMHLTREKTQIPKGCHLFGPLCIITVLFMYNFSQSLGVKSILSTLYFYFAIPSIVFACSVFLVDILLSPPALGPALANRRPCYNCASESTSPSLLFLSLLVKRLS